MELFERETYLNKMRDAFKQVLNGIGHVILIAGDAGLGKTSLVNKFTTEIEDNSNLLRGACDQLFTPRPLSPLFDISNKLSPSIKNLLDDSSKRGQIFTNLLDYFKSSTTPVVFIIEDIHWADETTLDLIVFLGRRISRSNCLMVLTYRENEIQENNNLKYVLADLPSADHTKLKLNNLNEETVYKMALAKNLANQNIYEITKGHPFFVSEIIANPKESIPQNISDFILSRAEKLTPEEIEILELVSLFPKDMEISLLMKMKPNAVHLIDNVIKSKILVNEGNVIRFKHDISRQVIYNSISSFKRIHLHGLVLEELIIEENYSCLALYVHHAKNANITSLVAKWAPIAALKASDWGAHNEAAKLFNSHPCVSGDWILDQ